jgi:hypothetical protein
MSVDDNFIYLPVSVGEAIDKLSILDIKLEKIMDSRVIDVQKEYDLLYEKLSVFVLKYKDLYETIKKVNTLIWNMMDVVTSGQVLTEEYLKVCRECFECNDIRFRVKNKINYISNSTLKEQKGYKKNRLVIEISKDIKDISDFIIPIKYYSFLYDEIVVLHMKNSGLICNFLNDPTIIFGEKENNNELENIKKYILFEEENSKESIYKKFEVSDSIMNVIL